MRILILEENADRRNVMLEHIADCLPMFGVSFIESSLMSANRGSAKSGSPRAVPGS